MHSLWNCAILGSAFAQFVPPAQFAACAINTYCTKALSQTQNTRSYCFRCLNWKLRNFVANLKLDHLRIICANLEGWKRACAIFIRFLQFWAVSMSFDVCMWWRNIARIANAIQCHNWLSGTKAVMTHEFRFSIVRIIISVSNVTSPRIVQKPENLQKSIKNLPKIRKSSKTPKILQKSENLPKIWTSSKNLKIIRKYQNLPKN